MGSGLHHRALRGGDLDAASRCPREGVFSKSMSEPIEDRRELDEGGKSDGRFFETGAGATMAVDAAEDVFDFVPAPIIAAMERCRTTARTLWRDADAWVLTTQSGAKVVGVEAFVADDTPLPQATEQGFNGEGIVALALSQSECDGAPTTLDDGRQPGVDAFVGSADGLCRFSAAGTRPMLVQLDGRTTDIAQFPFRALRDGRKPAGEQFPGAPSSEPRADRTPRTKALPRIAPRNAGVQDSEQGREHNFTVRGRPTPARTPAAFGARTVGFFNPRHTGGGNSRRLVIIKRAFRSNPPHPGSLDFKKTRQTKYQTKSYSLPGACPCLAERLRFVPLAAGIGSVPALPCVR